MRIYEVLTEKQLDEISIKQAATAAAVFGAAFAPHPANTPNLLNPNIEVVKVQPTADRPSVEKPDIVQPSAEKPSIEQPKVDQPPQEIKKDATADLTKVIVDRYKIDPNVASQIVEVVDKYSHPVFPTTEDILSVIGIESSFDHMAKSKLRRDPAKGLMQVRPGIWKIPKSELRNIEGQIKHGVKILRRYYEKLKDDEATLRAYNLGITRYKKNPDDPRGDRYIKKFEKEKQLYASL